MKVVLDTNVFISSFMGGKPRKVIEFWKAGRITLCLSSALIEEYLEILKRLGISARPECHDLLQLLRQSPHVLFVKKPPIVRVVPEDRDDDMLFACAQALRAEVIITGDKAVLRHDRWKGIHVLTVEQFLSSLID